MRLAASDATFYGSRAVVDFIDDVLQPAFDLPSFYRADAPETRICPECKYRNLPESVCVCVQIVVNNSDLSSERIKQIFKRRPLD